MNEDAPLRQPILIGARLVGGQPPEERTPANEVASVQIEPPKYEVPRAPKASFLVGRTQTPLSFCGY